MKNNISLTRVGLLICVSFLFIGCKPTRPKDILSPKVMEQVLYEYHMVQALEVSVSNDKKYELDYYYSYIYQHNNITEAQLNHSLKWYSRHPDDFYEIYERMSKRAEKDWSSSASILERQHRVSFRVESGDNVDLWYLPHSNAMGNHDLMRTMTFAITADTTFYLGDSIFWEMNPLFVKNRDTVNCNSQHTPSLYLSLNLLYRNQETVFDTLVSVSDSLCFGFKLHDINSLSRIEGAVQYLPDPDAKASFLILDDIHLMRKHNNTAPAAPATKKIK
ncbi:MAG: DUF4296 domain-containing protein [Bacteroidaceae bacterium]|nr:DUF4296 domain-containing protein [Bacteroidaceae bacterium]